MVAWDLDYLVGARFSNFLLGKLSRQFKLRGMSIFHEIQMAIFRYCVTLQSHGSACWCPTCIVHVDMNLTRSKVKVKVTEHLNFPTIAHSCIFLGLSPPLSRGTQNWQMTVIVRDMVYSLSESDFRISLYESYHESSNFLACRYCTKF